MIIRAKVNETSNGQFIITMPKTIANLLLIKKGDYILWESFKKEVVIKKDDGGYDDGTEYEYTN